jgi:hypothetical protein
MEYGFDARRAELVELFFIDQSESYEVDQTGIYYDKKAPAGKRFVILSASGCS